MVAADPNRVVRMVVAHRAAVMALVAAGQAVHRAVVRRWTVAAPVDPIVVAQRAVARMMMVVVAAYSYYGYALLLLPR